MPTRTPKPLPRPTAKVVVRELVRGIPVSDRNNVNHTSFRLSPEDRHLLRELAKRKYGGITMSAVLRIWIRAAAKEEGIT